MERTERPVPHRNDARWRDENQRQFNILKREMPVRIGAALLAYGMALAFLPLWLVVACVVGDIIGEIVAYRLQQRPERLQDRRVYLLYLASVFLSEGSFSVPAAVMWHMDDPYVKALAVGLMASAMMHIATVRAIHLPMGLSAATSVSLLVLVSNSAFWINRGEPAPLLVTTLCAVVAFGYFFAAMLSNHALHREAAADRAEAQAANIAKGRFLAQMSHELRTPLNAILGMGHAELRRSRDPVSRDRLEVLISSAEGLSTILDDILDLSAVQDGRLPVRPVPVNPRDAIAATVALFRPSIDRAGLALQLDLAADLPVRALLDPQRLRQCLSNLLSNALKHTTAGTIHVRVRRETRIGAQPLLRIEVSDTGTGIPAAQRSAIFEPFMRGLSPGPGDKPAMQRSGTPPLPPASPLRSASPLPTGSQPRAGNGLGLSISRALARQMGGDLQVADPPQGIPGATLILTLALIDLPGAPVVQPPPLAPMPAGKEALVGRLVLVVDDIATNRMVAVAYLHMMGARALEAAGGAEAQEIIAREPVDLVLLDMNMPGMNGIEAFHLLRAMPAPKSVIPVVAMTADAMAEHRRAYLGEGMDGYIAKPIMPDPLAAEMARVLTARQPV